jgi:antitoxin (DNA-binding transcriptional repressor) of toxin-antitoxin stability system
VSPRGRRIDAAHLPSALVELVEALGPGDELVITRDGEPIATVHGTRRTPVDPDHVTVVATAMKLSAAARGALSAELGENCIVLDMHAAPRTADVVLVPPGSPQLVAGLRSAFPDARVVVTEIEDPDLGVSYRGPIRRMLDAGAEAYLASTTIPRLGAQLGRVIVERKQIAGGPAGRLEIEPTDPIGNELLDR